MKFLKSILLTATLFVAVTGIVVYSSCEKDLCTDVSCKNGGSCSKGICKCPTGYEGPTCSTVSVSRFVGVYAGYTTCNNGDLVIDTVFISPISVKYVSNAYVVQKSVPYDLLTATVHTDETTYSLEIPDRMLTNYRKKYHITLQSSDKLVLDTYEQNYMQPDDTIINHCIFTGFKVATP